MEQAQKREKSSTPVAYEQTPLLIEGAEAAASELDIEDGERRNGVSI